MGLEGEPELLEGETAQGHIAGFLLGFLLFLLQGFREVFLDLHGLFDVLESRGFGRNVGANTNFEDILRVLLQRCLIQSHPFELIILILFGIVDQAVRHLPQRQREIRAELRLCLVDSK